MKKYSDLVDEILAYIQELYPWDLEELIQQNDKFLLIDIREPCEFSQAHIEHSINVPRGLLESACDWGYDDTVPQLVKAREEHVVLICRSGNRSALAAFTLQQMGYAKVRSLKTGLKGWNDSELKLIDLTGQPVDPDDAEEFFRNKPNQAQLGP